MATDYPTGRPTIDYPFAAIPEGLLYDEHVSSTAVRIYGVLARFAFEEGANDLQVTHEAIAERLHCSPRSVARPLADLEERGWIERQKCNTWMGRGPDFFHLHSHRAEMRTGVGAHRADSRGPVRADSRGLTTPKEIEILALVEVSEDHPPTPAAIDAEFERWWKEAWCSNKRVSKAEAKKEYRKARKEVEADALFDGAVAYARLTKQQNTEPRHIVHPNRWLKNRRWEDEMPEVPNPFDGPEMRFG